MIGRHHILLKKFAIRIQVPQVLRLIKIIIKAGGSKIGVPQGGPFGPLASNVYLNDVDWYFDEIRKKTSVEDGKYEAINYHRFADDIVITVSGHDSKEGWCERAMLRLSEQLDALQVQLNLDKTKVVDMLAGETFGFLGFDFKREINRKSGKPLILLTPKKKARKSIKEKIRENIQKGGHLPVKDLIRKINSSLIGWVNFYRVGKSSRAFSEVREYLEFKIRTLLTRRKRRRKRSVGWCRWSSEYQCCCFKKLLNNFK